MEIFIGAISFEITGDDRPLRETLAKLGTTNLSLKLGIEGGQSLRAFGTDLEAARESVAGWQLGAALTSYGCRDLQKTPNRTNGN